MLSPWLTGVISTLYMYNYVSMTREGGWLSSDFSVSS